MKKIYYLLFVFLVVCFASMINVNAAEKVDLKKKLYFSTENCSDGSTNCAASSLRKGSDFYTKFYTVKESYGYKYKNKVVPVPVFHITINKKEKKAIPTRLLASKLLDSEKASFELDSSYPPTKAYALKAGIAIDAIKEDFGDAEEDNLRYLYYALTFDALANKSNSLKIDKKIKNTLVTYYKAYAEEVFKNRTLNFCYLGDGLKKKAPINVSVEGGSYLKTLSSSQNNDSVTYISNPINISGYVDKFCDKTVSYTLTASPSNAVICTDAAGKHCTSSNSTNTKETTVYIKVTYSNGTTPSGNVTLNILGKTDLTYKSVSRYLATSDKSKYSPFMVTTSVKYSHSTSGNATLRFPQTSISVANFDDEGELLEGASLELYKASDEDGKNKIGDTLATNPNGSATFSSNGALTSDYYCLNETKAPTGFLLRDTTHCFKASNTDSKVCLDGDSHAKDEWEYCDAKWVCSNDVEPVDRDNNKVCYKITESINPNVCVTGYEFDENSDKCLSTDIGPVDSESGQCALEEVSVRNSNDELIGCKSVQNPACPSDYTPDGGKCIKSESPAAQCKSLDGNTSRDNKYCQESDNSSFVLVTQQGGKLSFNKPNVPSRISVSKKDITGTTELSGAAFKICSKKPDASGNCDPVTITQRGLKCPTVKDDEDESATEANVTGCTYDENTHSRTISAAWTSNGVVSSYLYGLETGKKYYLVEYDPPLGYVSLSSYTEFEIQENGDVKYGNNTLSYDSDDPIVIKNKLSEFIFENGIAGSVVAICDASVDDKGNWSAVTDVVGDCTIATKADGELASWTVANGPHTITGLPVGNYYLVEINPAKGYSTAESIPFTLGIDGTLRAKDGNVLKSLAFSNEQLSNLKTGNLTTYVIMLFFTMAAICGGGSYYFLKKKGYE